MIETGEIHLQEIPMIESDILQAEYYFCLFCVRHQVFSLFDAIKKRHRVFKCAPARQNFPTPLPMSRTLAPFWVARN